MNTIQVDQSGHQIDQELKALSDTMTEDNNGLILYIREGKLTLDTYENLFSVIPLV